MKLTYRQRLFLYVAILFAIFAFGVFIFENSRERKFKTEALVEKLDAYAEIAHATIEWRSASEKKMALDSLMHLLPSNIRLSLIDNQGNVIYDNSVENLSVLQNHADRPEIVNVLKYKKGTDIRLSASTEQEYLYYAKKYGTDYIRVALPYDIQTQRFLKGDNLFLYFILAFFIVVLVFVNAIASRFGESIRQLRDFVVSSDKDVTGSYIFPKDELGEIGSKITESYLQLRDSKRTIDTEREKLLQHIHSSEEGICFFTYKREVEFYNGLFIQYLNTLTSEPQSEPHAVFTDEVFRSLNDYLSNPGSSYFETVLSKYGKTFSLRVNIFEDKSFEIVINDITRLEKTRRLKQEMTGNIAHELRTPVTSIRGYLETVLEQPLDDEKKNYFTNKAFEQSIVLSELIQDMSLITKIEEAPQAFKLESVNINQLLKTLRNDLLIPLQDKDIDMTWNVSSDTLIYGSKNLLYSIFRNLVDNVIRYAGEQLSININLYREDENFFYFSFSDTGVGIDDEKHLSRLFERFYRISEGRSRDTGGSGLGLSIVRNAVAFHQGTIVAKNKKDSGLEFLFQLRKL